MLAPWGRQFQRSKSFFLKLQRDNERLQSVLSNNGAPFERRMGEFCGGTAPRTKHERFRPTEDGRRAIQILQVYFEVS